MNKKGQINSGLVTSIIVGIAGIVIAIVIAFIVVNSLLGSENLLDSTTNTVTNETIAWANGTDYTVDNSGASAVLNARNFVLTDAWASTGVSTGGYDLQYTNLASNLSLDSTTGILTNLTAENNTIQSNLSISYTYVTDGLEEESAKALSANFTAGADNISEQVPTILLIAAIVLVLTVIAVLVGVWQRFNFRGSNL